MNAITTNIKITKTCGQRDQALALAREAANLLARGHELALQAQAAAASAAAGTVFHGLDRRQDSAYRDLFASIDVEASLEVFRRQTDACVWASLLDRTGMRHLMDATALESFRADLCANVPEVTEDSILATLEGLRSDARLIFQRGLARTFSELDKRFKSHDAFKIGSRVILTNVFDATGWMHAHGTTAKMLTDVERTIAVLDGAEPDPDGLLEAIEKSRGSRWAPTQGCTETRYMRVRTFKNGNAHLWFTRDDLVEKANLLLADYYGEVLPDAWDVDDMPVRSGLPAKDLSFYRSPPAVAAALLRDVYVPKGGRVLEPSAGDGALVRALVQAGHTVDAIEIHAGRAEQVRQLAGVGSVRCCNFLTLEPMPIYDAVVANPPFYGTHWADHVRRAFEWLAPGGVLHVVLPATAEAGETKRHHKFRAWATKHTRWGDLRFEDLPQESFKASGTRVNTVILRLYKER